MIKLLDNGDIDVESLEVKNVISIKSLQYIQDKFSKLTGISQNALNKIYHNKTKGIDFETLNKLCNILQKNSQEIFEFTPD